jgi:O-antigen/teichoic acid export membrane protein
MSAAGKGLATLRAWRSDTLLRRVFANAGVLVSGHAAAGILSIVNLAIAARAMGPNTFGTLLLIHTYALTAAEVFGFESWQTFVRFGSQRERPDWHVATQLLFKFTSTLDLGAALLGTVAAILAAPLVGRWLGWDHEATRLAMAYALVIPFTVNATPSGVLRLFNRFDLLARHVTLRSAARVLMTVLAWACDASLQGYLLAWFWSEIIGQLILLVMGWREFGRQGLLVNIGWSARGTTQLHESLWRFIAANKLHSTVLLVRGPLTLLLVGGVLDAAATAFYRVAKGLAVILIRPTELLTNSIYPDLAGLIARGELVAARRLVLRASLVMGAGIAVAAALIAILGQPLLALSAGADYRAAYPVLLLLVLAAAVEAFGSALDPTLYALGKPGVAARINSWLILCYAPLLIVLLQSCALPGAGYAMLAYAVAATVIMTCSAAWYLAPARHALAAPVAGLNP